MMPARLQQNAAASARAKPRARLDRAGSARCAPPPAPCGTDGWLGSAIAAPAQHPTTLQNGPRPMGDPTSFHGPPSCPRGNIRAMRQPQAGRRRKAGDRRAARGVSAILNDLLVGARLGLALPKFLRHALTPADARAALRQRLARRSAVFLETVRRTVYGQPDSPYAHLLTWAGCEMGDLERLVDQDGIEGALRTLVRHGVYLTVEEFKGRRPVVRGNATLAVEPSRLQNPLSTAHVLGSTSGSRGPGIPVASDLAFIRDRAVNTAVVLDARGDESGVTPCGQFPGPIASSHCCG